MLQIFKVGSTYRNSTLNAVLMATLNRDSGSSLRRPTSHEAAHRRLNTGSMIALRKPKPSTLHKPSPRPVSRSKNGYSSSGSTW